MFWGFVLEPKKRYNTTVSKPFHISMAALDPKTITDNDISSLVLNVDGIETILCNLKRPDYLQERLDLNFIEGNTITLEVKGKATVHLSGYFIYEQDGMDEDDSELEDEEDLEDEDEETDTTATTKALKALKKQMGKKSKFNASPTEEDSDEDDDDDSEYESMDVSDLTFDEDGDDDDDDDEDDDEDEDDEDDDDEEEEEEISMGGPGSTPMPPQKKNKQMASANNTPVSANKKKQQQQQESGKKNKGDKQQQQQSPQKPLTNGSTPNTPNSNKKKKKDKQQQENGVATPGANTPKTPKQQPQQQGGATPKKTLEGGVIVEDVKVGSGAPAKSGKMVSVFYVGKLKANNKQFDSSTSGPGFKFRLGKGEVIKGWDVGLNGMKVGGKRRLTIPAHMAYGNKGSPPAIPPNSTLLFDVELKNVN